MDAETVRRSFFTGLSCASCGKTHDGSVVQGLSTCHDQPLVSHYDTDAARERIVGSDTTGLFDDLESLWRYAKMLPPVPPTRRVSLGEGWTPLERLPRLGASMGLPHLWGKDEGLNPTGSFKARGMALAVSRACVLGLDHLAAPTAGNAGGALAAYCARAGVRATVAMPRDAPAANKAEVRAHGADLVEVDGLISDCGAWLRRHAEELGAFDVSTLKEPYRLEGKKTMGYELWEQAARSGRTLPDVIVYPTGGGTGLIGMWRAFAELEALGLIGSERPRMVAVQSAGCAPIVRAFDAGAETAEPWEAATTIASGLRVPAAVGDRLILDAVRRSGGTAIAVAEEEIVHGVHQLARLEGRLVSPEAGATVAGARQLREDGAIGADEQVALFLTGSGLKHISLFGG